jgi:hypothetical protein
VCGAAGCEDCGGCGGGALPTAAAPAPPRLTGQPEPAPALRPPIDPLVFAVPPAPARVAHPFGWIILAFLFVVVLTRLARR